jgi:hypothetical protein
MERREFLSVSWQNSAQKPIELGSKKHLKLCFLLPLTNSACHHGFKFICEIIAIGKSLFLISMIPASGIPLFQNQPTDYKSKHHGEPSATINDRLL